LIKDLIHVTCAPRSVWFYKPSCVGLCCRIFEDISKIDLRKIYFVSRRIVAENIIIGS